MAMACVTTIEGTNPPSQQRTCNRPFPGFQRGAAMVSSARGVTLSLAVLLQCPFASCSAAEVVVHAMAKRAIMPLEGLAVEAAVYDNHLTHESVARRIRESGIKLLRYPGGSYSDLCHWETHSSTGGTNWMPAGSDFRTFMSKVVIPAGCSAMITVNYGSNASGSGGADPDGEAPRWVQFANLTQHYGIKYWEIGNEIFGNGIYGAHWEMDLHSDHSPMAYANNVRLFVRSMKAIDPTIKIGAVLTTPGYWPDAMVLNWNREVLQRCGPEIDFVIVHYYPQTGFPKQEGAQSLPSTREIPEIVARLHSLINQFCGTNAPNVQIAVSETCGGNFSAGSFSAESLFAADVYLSWIENGALTVAWHQLLNSFLIATNTPGCPFYGAMMAGSLAGVGDTLLGVDSSQSELRVHAAAQPHGIGVILINENPSNSKNVTVRIKDVPLRDSGLAYQFGPANFPPGAALPASGPTTNVISGLGNHFEVTVPAYSMLVLSVPAETNLTGIYRLVPSVMVSGRAPSTPGSAGTALTFTNDESGQSWMIQSLGGGTCRLSPLTDTNSVLQAENSVDSAGRPVDLKRWNAGPRQQWMLGYNGDGTFRLTPKAKPDEALSLGLRNHEPAALFQSKVWSGSVNQRWYLVSP